MENSIIRQNKSENVHVISNNDRESVIIDSGVY
jgi:hypothetical protein